jgi:hypothetical protein
MATRREMTETERKQLEKLLEARSKVNWKEHFWLFVASLTVIPAIYSALALFLLAVIARIFGFPTGNGAWRDHPVIYYGAVWVVVTIWIGSVVADVRWSVRSERDRRLRKSKLETDLTGGVVRDETFSVTGIKLLREPEHSMILFFLLLSNGRCFVLYDYESVDTDNEHDGQSRPTLVPGENFHLLTFPVSKERSWSFSRLGLPLPAVLPLELGPEDWPEDESWCRVKWENIERHYGPKRSRQVAASRRS